MLNFFSKQKLIDLFFPKFCFNCGQEGDFLCQNCLSEIKEEELSCPYCKKVNFQGDLCLKHQRHFQLDGLLFYSFFQSLPQKLVYALKYEGLKDVGKIMACLMAKKLKEHSLFIKEREKIVLCPLPLYWLKKLKRGFNQAEILANLVGKNLDLEVLNLLLRIKNTQSQTKLNKLERQKNMEQAFILSKKIDPDQLKGENIVLVDDVFTTGFTLNSAAQAIKKLQPKSIWGLVFARD